MRLICLLFLIISLSGCYQNKALTQNTLIYCTESLPSSFNPQISHDVASLDATTHQLFNRLVKIEESTNQFVPDLAESWEQSEDKLTYRFTLRENIHFHHTDYFTPTRTLNADDVLFSLNRMLDVNNPYHSLNNQGNNFFYNHPFTSLLSEINKIDDRTIEFVLLKPDVTLLANLAAHYSVIHSKEYADQLLAKGTPSNIDFEPIGTGPFKFKQYDNNSTIRYSKNTQYWQKMGNIDNLIYFTNPSASKRYTKLLSGECDAISYPAASQLETINQNENVSIISKVSANIALWAFNTQKDILKDYQVRQAISEAVNVKTILSAVYFQSALKTETLLNKQSWALKANIDKQLFSPAESKKTLQSLGYNFSKILTILVPDSGDTFNPNFHKTAELIQANLSDIGIRSTIINLSGKALKDRLKKGDYDTYLTGINVHINDPDSIFRPLLSCDSTPNTGNSSHWCSPETQALLDQSLTESNFTQRIKNYYKIQVIARKQRPYLPIAHVLRLDAISHSISNIDVNPLTGISFQNAIKEDLN